MLLALLFKFNFFGDINFSVMECLIFSALITTTVSGPTVSVFSKLSADPMLAMIMLVVYIISDVQLRRVHDQRRRLDCHVQPGLFILLLSPMSFTTLLIAGLDIIGMTIEMITNSPSPPLWLIGATVALVCTLILKYMHFTSTVTETVIISPLR